MKKIVSLAVMFLFVSSICFAQVKVYKIEGAEDIPSNKSQDEIVSVLIDKLTKEAIEKSDIKLRKYKLSKNEYNDFVKNFVKVEIKNKKVFMKKGNQPCTSIKLNVQMDPDEAKNYLDNLKAAKEAKKENADNKVQQEVQTIEKVENPEPTENVEKAEKNITPTVSEILDTPSVETKPDEDKKADKKAKKEAEKKAKKEAKKEKKSKGKNSADSKQETPTVEAKIKTEKPDNVTSSAVVSEVNVIKNKMSIDQALDESYKVKQEVKGLLDNFDKTLEESKSSDTKTKISETAVSIIKPKIEYLKSFLQKKVSNKVILSFIQLIRKLKRDSYPGNYEYNVKNFPKHLSSIKRSNGFIEYQDNYGAALKVLKKVHYHIFFFFFLIFFHNF